MLSGEGMQRRRTVKNNNRSNQQKSNFARAAHFFVHFFAVVLHDYNVKLPETSQLHVLWRKCRTCCRSIFSLPLIFTLHWWPLAFLIFSSPLQNFHVVLPQKKCLLCFYLSFQISVAPFLVELRWPAAHFLFFYLSLTLQTYLRKVAKFYRLFVRQRGGAGWGWGWGC